MYLLEKALEGWKIWLGETCPLSTYINTYSLKPTIMSQALESMQEAASSCSNRAWSEEVLELQPDFMKLLIRKMGDQALKYSLKIP